MRKTLIIILIVLLIILNGYTAFYGLKIGGLSISGISQVKKQTEQLDQKISEASKLSSTDYQKALSDLDTSYKDLQTEKENYDSMVSLSSDEDIQKASRYDKYEIETLWVKLGNHAKSEGIDIKLSLTNSSSGTNGLYDIKFTCVGSYVGITNYIYDIENDSELGFKIEDFKLIPSTDTALQGTFTCKDININIQSSQLTSSGSSSSTTNTNTTTNNTTTATNTVQ